MSDAAVLTVAPPGLTDGQALAVLERHWGLRAVTLGRLASERDQNFRVEAASGRYILKIANAAEPASVTRVQTDLIGYVGRRDPTLPVPRVVPTRTGELLATEHGSSVRLLTWLEGIPWHLTPRTRRQRESIAAGHARLVQAMAGFATAAPAPVLPWDIQHAASLRGHLDAVRPGWRGAVADALERFDRHAAPLLARLRRQYVHNDLQPHNVVVSEADPDRLSGILDFGDMVLAPIACDLGVAGAYHVLPGAHPLETVGEYVRAFHAHCPLTQDELQALPALVMARQVTTIVISSWRAGTHPENAAYIVRNQPVAIAGLLQLLPLPHDAAVAYFRSLCP